MAHLWCHKKEDSLDWLLKVLFEQESAVELQISGFGDSSDGFIGTVATTDSFVWETRKCNPCFFLPILFTIPFHRCWNKRKWGQKVTEHWFSLVNFKIDKRLNLHLGIQRKLISCNFSEIEFAPLWVIGIEPPFGNLMNEVLNAQEIGDLCN